MTTTTALEHQVNILAKVAHLNQRKWHKPYYNLLLDVTKYPKINCSSIARMAAMLRSTVNDTDVTLKDLKTFFEGYGCGGEVIVDTVEALTRKKGESYKDYILRVKKHDLAPLIKIASIRQALNHNPSVAVKNQLELALTILEGDSDESQT